MTNASKPLSVDLTDDVLTISIGIDTMATAILAGPYFEREGLSGSKVTDQRAFAEAVKLELEQEDEEGTNFIHQMFDTAASAAIENGAEGIVLEGEDND